MANVSYYKCEDPEVIQIEVVRQMAILELKARGKAFAEHFGGELLGRNDIHAYSLSGLRFNPPKDINIWTKPNPNDGNIQYPRLKVKKEFKEASAQLLKEYKEKFPTERVSMEPLLQALGTSWGNVLFSPGGFSLFSTESAVYVATGLKLNESCKEILASEFMKAREE